MASELLTVRQVKSLGVGVNLDDVALTLVIDGEDEWLQRYTGAHSGSIVIIRPINQGKVYVSRLIDTLISARHSFYDFENWAPIVPLPSVSADGTYVYTNQSYIGSMELTYQPKSDIARRRNTLIELLKNTLAYTGNMSLEVPGMNAEWERQRQCILKQFDYRFGVA